MQNTLIQTTTKRTSVLVRIHKRSSHPKATITYKDKTDLQHHLWALTLDGKLGLSPPNAAGAKPGRVLDAGTGTGIWAIDFGDDHPDSQIIGVDLSPTQPSL